MKVIRGLTAGKKVLFVLDDFDELGNAQRLMIYGASLFGTVFCTSGNQSHCGKMGMDQRI